MTDSHPPITSESGCAFKLSDAYVESLVRIISLRDVETEEHTRRCASMALDLARLLNASSRQLLHIYRGTLLHDVGKIGLPDLILRKREALTADESTLLQFHPIYGYEILRPIPIFARRWIFRTVIMKGGTAQGIRADSKAGRSLSPRGFLPS